MLRSVLAQLRAVPGWLFWGYLGRFCAWLSPAAIEKLCAPFVLLQVIFARRRGALILDELRRCGLMPDAPPARVLFAVFRNRLMSQLKLAYLPTLTPGNTPGLIEVEGLEHLDRARGEGRGVILLNPHFGPFMLVMPALGHRGYALHQVALQGEPITGRRTGFIRKSYYAKFRAIEGNMPVKFINAAESRMSIREVIRALDANETVLFASTGRGGKSWGDLALFGRDSSLNLTPFNIAVKGGAEVLPVFVLDAKPFAKVVIGEPLRRTEAATPEDLMRQYATVLEGFVQRYPEHFASFLHDMRKQSWWDDHPFFNDYPRLPGPPPPMRGRTVGPPPPAHGGPPGGHLSEGGVARRVARNSAFLMMSKVIEIGITFVITALTARYLGVEKFGLFAVATAVSTALVPLADFGVERIVCREISRDASRAASYVGTTFVMRAAFSSVILLAAWGVLGPMENGGLHMSKAIMLAIGSDLLWSLGMTFIGIVRAYERMGFEFVINAIYKLSFLAFVIGVIRLDMGFIGIFQARLLSAFVFTVLAAGVLHWKFVAFAFSFSRRLALFILKESYPLAISSLFLALIFRVDVFVLKWLGTPADIAFFEVPNRLIMQLQILPVSFSLALFPVLARSAGGEGGAGVGEYYGNAFKFLLMIAVPMTGLLIAGGGPLIMLLFGEDFARASVSLYVLAPTVVFLFLISLQNLYLTARNRQILNTYAIAVALAVNFLLAVLFVPRWGYVGASVAALTAFTAMFAINTFFVSRMGVFHERMGYVPRLLAAGAAMMVVMTIHTGHALATLVLRCGIAAVVFAVVVFALRVLSAEDIAMLKGLIARRRGRMDGGGRDPIKRGAC